MCVFFQMTMEDRLNAISMDVNGKPAANEPPKADTLSKLLTQGLQSQDKKILNVSTRYLSINN